jgi:hypothetical protein
MQDVHHDWSASCRTGTERRSRFHHLAPALAVDVQYY